MFQGHAEFDLIPMLPVLEMSKQLRDYILDSGDIYAWGWNESGQVGVLTTKRENGEMKVDSDSGSAVVLSPTLLFSTDDDLIIDSISCGSRHSAAVSG